MNPPALALYGATVTLPAISFAAVRRVAPLLDQMATLAPEAASRGWEVRSLMLQAVAIFAGRDPAQAEEELSFVEAAGISERWGDILAWAGLVPASGEAPAASSPMSVSAN